LTSTFVLAMMEINYLSVTPVDGGLVFIDVPTIGSKVAVIVNGWYWLQLSSLGYISPSWTSVFLFVLSFLKLEDLV